jgi:hypothetical protein
LRRAFLFLSLIMLPSQIFLLDGQISLPHQKKASHSMDSLFEPLRQSCTSRAHRTVCEDVCSSACTRANDATARPGM